MDWNNLWLFEGPHLLPHCLDGANYLTFVETVIPSFLSVIHRQMWLHCNGAIAIYVNALRDQKILSSMNWTRWINILATVVTRFISNSYDCLWFNEKYGVCDSCWHWYGICSTRISCHCQSLGKTEIFHNGGLSAQHGCQASIEANVWNIEHLLWQYTIDAEIKVFCLTYSISFPSPTGRFCLAKGRLR